MVDLWDLHKWHPKESQSLNRTLLMLRIDKPKGQEDHAKYKILLLSKHRQIELYKIDKQRKFLIPPMDYCMERHNRWANGARQPTACYFLPPKETHQL